MEAGGMLPEALAEKDSMRPRQIRYKRVEKS